MPTSLLDPADLLASVPRQGTTADASSGRRWLTRARVADTAVLAALAWWATRLTWGTGGRDPHVVSVAAVLTAVALVADRGWRELPRVVIWLTVAVMIAAAVVVGTAPTGLRGANEAASYVVAATTFLAVAGWARDPQRRLLVLGAVVGAGGAEFAKAFLPWWGGGDPSRLMWGTFYWHNQFAAFLVPTAVLSLAAIVTRVRPWSMLGWVVLPLSVAGVIFSTSRGEEMACGLGLAALLVLTARVQGWRPLVRAGAAVVLALLVTAALSGPPFFHHRASMFAGTTARASSLRGNGMARLEFWIDAARVWERWPVTGAGFHSFASAANQTRPVHDANVSAYVHNGYLQAASDGGTVLALPFLAACVLIAFSALRQLKTTLVRRDRFIDAAVAVAVIVTMLHSGMDFDWAYPSLFMQFALLAALLTASTVRRMSARHSTWHPRVALAIAGMAAAAATIAAWHGIVHLNVPV